METPLPSQRNGRIVAISNQKGGSAKTMTAINLGEACARVKYKVLIVDLDGQGNATTSLGVKAEDLPQDGSLFNVFMGEKVDIRKMIRKSNREKLQMDLIPTSEDLQQMDVGILELGIRRGIVRGRAGESEADLDPFVREAIQTIYFHLSDALEPLRADYDLILLDCPPGYNCVTGNALLASDCVIIPLDSGPWSYGGAKSALKHFETLQDVFGKPVMTLGMLLCKFKPKQRLHQQILSLLETHYASLLFETTISESVRYTEAAGNKKSLWEWDNRRESLAGDYEKLAVEVLKRLKLSPPSPEATNPEQPSV